MIIIFLGQIQKDLLSTIQQIHLNFRGNLSIFAPRRFFLLFKEDMFEVRAWWCGATGAGGGARYNNIKRFYYCRSTLNNFFNFNHFFFLNILFLMRGASPPPNPSFPAPDLTTVALAFGSSKCTFLLSICNFLIGIVVLSATCVKK